MTQIKAHLMEKNISADCSQVAVLVLAGWTKEPLGHYAIFKLFPSDHQVKKLLMVKFLRACSHEADAVHYIRGKRHLFCFIKAESNNVGIRMGNTTKRGG